MVLPVSLRGSLARSHSRKCSINREPSAQTLSRLGVGSCIPPIVRMVVQARSWLAAAAALATALGDGSVARRGMVVCSVGTGDQQDLMLSHIGLTAIPVTQLIRCDD